MSEVQVKMEINLLVSKEEFTLITKALTGHLRPEEIEKAKELGCSLLGNLSNIYQKKLQANTHAHTLALSNKEETK